MKAQNDAGDDLLTIDVASEVDSIVSTIPHLIVDQLRRRGAVVGVSGGIDSSVVAALCARALGPERVVILLMPEADSSDDSLRMGKLLAEQLRVRYYIEEITPILEAAGCYRRRDDAIAAVFPEFGPGHRAKIVLPDINSAQRYSLFSLVVQTPTGEVTKMRLTASAYLSIVAATNFKQRVRKMMEYHYADRFQFAVAGTPNRLEFDQGFFVKNGDGAADFKPIAHLYKSQVYRIAEHLAIPEEIRRRPPTTDTYSLQQSQEEFYFSVPLWQMDHCLYGKNNGIPVSVIASITGLQVAQVERVYDSIDSKRRATRYLHEPPLLVQAV